VNRIVAEVVAEVVAEFVIELVVEVAVVNILGLQKIVRDAGRRRIDWVEDGVPAASRNQGDHVHGHVFGLGARRDVEGDGDSGRAGTAAGPGGPPGRSIRSTTRR
jgi:hypothetical protein